MRNNTIYTINKTQYCIFASKTVIIISYSLFLFSPSSPPSLLSFSAYIIKTS